MKVEFDVKAFGQEEVEGTVDGFRSAELIRVHELSKETTLAQLELLLEDIIAEVEQGYASPDNCHAKITIRVKKENGELKFI